MSVKVDTKTVFGPGTTISEQGFETDLGNWVSSGYSGWVRESGPTPTGGTGASSAYEGSYYVYVETNDSYYNGNEDYLEYTFTVTTEGFLEFAYYMYGSQVGTLSVEFYDGTNWVEVWSKSGEQGNGWITDSIEFPSANKIRFKSVKTINGAFGDVCLDSLHLTEKTQTEEHQAIYKAYLGSATIQKIMAGSSLVWEYVRWSDFSVVENLGLNAHVVKFNPDDSMIAFGTYNGEVKIYDTTNYSLIVTLTETTSQVTSLDWSSDGNRIGYGTTSDSSNAYVHNTTDFTLEKTFNESAALKGFAFSKDGRFIAAGGRDYGGTSYYYAYLYDANTYSKIHEWDMNDTPENIEFSSDGEHVAIGTSQTSHYVSIYNTSDYSQVFSESSDIEVILSYSKDGSTFAAVTSDKEVRVYDINSGSYSLSKVLTFDDYQYDVYSVELSRDGEYLVAGGYSKTRVVEVSTGNTVHQWSTGYQHDINISNNTRYLADVDGVIYRFHN